MEPIKSIIALPSLDTAAKLSRSSYRKLLLRKRLYKATSITYDSKRCLGRLSREQSKRLIRALTSEALRDTRPETVFAVNSRSGVWSKVGGSKLPRNYIPTARR